MKEFIQTVKDNKKLAVLSLVMLLTVIGGMAYAIFNFAFTGNTNTISVGPLSVTYLEGTDTITVNNALPESDAQGKATDPFDFVVKSNTSRNVNIVYTISLEKLSPSSGYTSLNDSDIDIYLTSGNTVLKDVTKVSDLNNNELYRTTHVHNSTNREVQTKYSLRAWIDKDVDASNWKSTTKLEYKFRVNVNALEVEPVTQSVTSGSATNLNISNLGISANIPANSVSASSVTLNAYPGGETFNISTEESTIPYEIKLTDAAGNDVTSTSPIAVQINIGKNLEVKSMMHGSTQMTKATTHAADTYEYNSSTGILTMYVTHFSEFKINVKKAEISQSNFVYSWSEEDVDIGDSLNSISGYTTDYTTLGYNFFLKHNIGSDNTVESNEVCYILNNNLYCLKGGDEGAAYEENKQVLLESFGESSCVTFPTLVDCSSLETFAGGAKDDGRVSASTAVIDCSVRIGGAASCSGDGVGSIARPDDGREGVPDIPAPIWP